MFALATPPQPVNRLTLPPQPPAITRTAVEMAAVNHTPTLLTVATNLLNAYTPEQQVTLAPITKVIAETAANFESLPPGLKTPETRDRIAGVYRAALNEAYPRLHAIQLYNVTIRGMSPTTALASFDVESRFEKDTDYPGLYALVRFKKDLDSFATIKAEPSVKSNIEMLEAKEPLVTILQNNMAESRRRFCKAVLFSAALSLGVATARFLNRVIDRKIRCDDMSPGIRRINFFTSRPVLSISSSGAVMSFWSAHAETWPTTLAYNNPFITATIFLLPILAIGLFDGMITNNIFDGPRVGTPNPRQRDKDAEVEALGVELRDQAR